jgi:hypothetical protein
VITGQAVEQGQEPLDQIHGGLDDRQFAAAGGGAGGQAWCEGAIEGDGWCTEMPNTMASWTFP